MRGMALYLFIMKLFDSELITDKAVHFKVDGCKSFKIKLYRFCFYDFHTMNGKILRNVGETTCTPKKNSPTNERMLNNVKKNTRSACPIVQLLYVDLPDD